MLLIVQTQPRRSSLNKYSKLWTASTLIGVWLLSALVVNDSLLVPTPYDSIQALIQALFTKKFWAAVYSSLYSLGLAWSIGMGITLAISAGAIVSRPLNNFFQQTSIIFGPLPAFAIMPVALIMFGISMSTMIIIMISSMIWLSLIPLLSSVQKSVDTWQPMVKNLSLSRYQAFVCVYFPSIVPDILIAAKNSWALCWRALLATEVVFGNLGTGRGIGVIMVENSTMINTAEVWGYLVFIIVLGVLITSLFDLVIKKDYDYR